MSNAVLNLRQLQLEELTILREVKRICEYYGIKYYLTAGTLLGAVRHNGFIPWDDDIDVAMPREDYDRFINVCKAELSNRFFLQNSYIEKCYPFYFSKIRINGTEVHEQIFEGIEINKGIYIDIFPLDVCPKNPDKAKFQFKMVRLLTCAYIGRVNKNYCFEYKKSYVFLVYRILKLMPCALIRWLRKTVAEAPAIFGSCGCLCTLDGTHDYPAETYDRPWFREQTELLFEGELYPVPVGWHDLLANMYGDYMTIPARGDISSHFTDYNEVKIP